MLQSRKIVKKGGRVMMNNYGRELKIVTDYFKNDALFCTDSCDIKV